MDRPVPLSQDSAKSSGTCSRFFILRIEDVMSKRMTRRTSTLWRDSDSEVMNLELLCLVILQDEVSYRGRLISSNASDASRPAHSLQEHSNEDVWRKRTTQTSDTFRIWCDVISDVTDFEVLLQAVDEAPLRTDD